jgi:hypothetical protein
MTSIQQRADKQQLRIEMNGIRADSLQGSFQYNDMVSVVDLNRSKYENMLLLTGRLSRGTLWLRYRRKWETKQDGRNRLAIPAGCD